MVPCGTEVKAYNNRDPLSSGINLYIFLSQEEVFPIDDKHKGPTGVIDVPRRFLMGPGPANADPRILAAQTLPLLGHM